MVVGLRTLASARLPVSAADLDGCAELRARAFACFLAGVWRRGLSRHHARPQLDLGSRRGYLAAVAL